MSESIGIVGWLRNRDDLEPRLKEAADEIERLTIQFDESESAQMCAGETIGELLSYIADAEAAIHYLVTEHVSMRDIEHIVGVYPTIKEALRSHAERVSREEQEEALSDE